jgi:hypothetical protein
MRTCARPRRTRVSGCAGCHRRVKAGFSKTIQDEHGDLHVKDMIPVYKATIAKGTNAIRWQQAAYVNLLPPCNNACPATPNETSNWR